MIPKQLFFIWIGDNKPNYADFVLKTFKDVNPDFNVDLFEDSLEDPKTEVIKNILLHLYHFWCPDRELADIAESELRQYTANYFKMGKVHLVVSNILRVYLTYKYGGIYLDLDTFPVKPFDEYLLSDNFQCYHDNFFHGCYKGTVVLNNCCNFQKLQICKYIRTVHEKIDDFDVNYKCDKFDINRKKFLNCDLKYGDVVLDNYNGTDYYIDHYMNNFWR